MRTLCHSSVQQLLKSKCLKLHQMNTQIGSLSLSKSQSTKSSHKKQMNVSSIYKNPISRLQPYLEVPILPESSKLFEPSEQEIEKGVMLFVNDRNKDHEISFVTSAVQMDRLPETSTPEIAFIGRSNVGKSSFIQSLFSAAPEVKVVTSPKPGRTRTLNFFKVGRAFSLVDMPGYGFNMPQHFHDSVEEYIQTRRRLVRTFLLIDGEVGVTRADRVGLDMMEELGKPYVLVMTKIDKAGRHTLLKNLLSLMEIRDKTTANSCFPQPFLLSSRTQEGVPLLQSFIAYITGSIQVKGM